MAMLNRSWRRFEIQADASVNFDLPSGKLGSVAAHPRYLTCEALAAAEVSG